jgi:hypothetical protein
MFLTRKHLSRRTVLKGAGATIGLPLLSAMIPAGVARALEAATPRRLAFIYIPHGAIVGTTPIPLEGLARQVAANDQQDRWTPNGVGRDFELLGDLASLAPYRDRVTVISNLDNSVAAAATPHGVHAGTWLTGTVPEKGARVYEDRISADQRAVEVIGMDTPLPSLELGTEPGGPSDPNYGWGFGQTLAHTRTLPLAPNYNPRNVFFQLFGRGVDADERLRIRAENRSLLDSVTGEMASLTRTLGTPDRAAVGDYLDGVREVERRIDLAEAAGVDSLELPPTPVGVPNVLEDHLGLMFELMTLAFQANLTNVCTFLASKEVSMRVFPSLGITNAWHPLSHLVGANRATRGQIVRLFTEQFATKLIARLAATPEGDGTLLDHSTIVWGSNMSDAAQHNFSPLPTVVVGRAGGAIRGGQHLIYPAGTPLNNLWVTLLNRNGVEVDRIGNSNGELAEV